MFLRKRKNQDFLFVALKTDLKRHYAKTPLHENFLVKNRFYLNAIVLSSFNPTCFLFDLFF